MTIQREIIIEEEDEYAESNHLHVPAGAALGDVDQEDDIDMADVEHEPLQPVEGLEMMIPEQIVDTVPLTVQEHPQKEIEGSAVDSKASAKGS